MKHSYQKPPVWKHALAAFDFNPDTTVFTYGDTIYNPGKISLSPDLVIHEEVHERQQKNMNVLYRFGPAIWWRKYLRDPKFRFEQELEAYRAQYAFFERALTDRQLKHKILEDLAGKLIGPMYGNMGGGLLQVMNMIRVGKTI